LLIVHYRNFEMFLQLYNIYKQKYIIEYKAFRALRALFPINNFSFEQFKSFLNFREFLFLNWWVFQKW